MGSTSELESRLRKAEDELAECERERDRLQQEALQTIVDAALDACYLLDAVRGPSGTVQDFVFTHLNTQAETLLGQAREAVLGAGLCELYPFHRDASPVTGHSLLEDYAAVYASQVPIRREIEVSNLPVYTKWYLQQVIGTTRGIAIMTRDITREKLLDGMQLELEQQAQRARNMESLGMVAGGVAHDFNNLLLAIGGFAELAQDQIRTSPDQARASLNQVLSATRRAAELTQQLLVWSNRRPSAASKHDLGALIARNLPLIRPLLPASVTLCSEIGKEPLEIIANETQLAQVLLNLCLNSRDAMPEGGTLIIRTRHARIEAGSEEINPGETPSDVARLQVIDTGHGMDEATLARMFEPFFTQKEVGKGTGLGLALVYSIVRRHGGTVRVRSAPGMGTTFTVDLPLARNDAQSTGAQEPLPPEGGHETILIVDDESAVRVLLSSALERAGYQALVASNGREALEVFKRKGAEIDLVILDAVMPGMNGHQTFEALRKRRPDLRVLFSTGYERDVFPRDFFQTGHLVLRKPYDVPTLLRAVRTALSPSE